MKQPYLLFTGFLLLIGVFSPLSAQNTGLKSVAVLKFDNRSAFPENDWVGLGFAETITTKLGFIEDLVLVERTKLHEILIANGKSENLDENKTTAGLQLAKLIGVEYLLIGSVQTLAGYEDPEGLVKINARIIETATAKIKPGFAFTVSGKMAGLFELETKIAADFCEALGLVAPLNDLAFEDAQNLVARQLFAEGLKKYYDNNFAEAIPLFREALKKNEGVFYAAAHTMEGTARRKQIEKAQTGQKESLKKAYLDQFRQDASEAAPAFYDLGIANRAVASYDEAIKNFGDYLKFMGSARKLRVNKPDGIQFSSDNALSYKYSDDNVSYSFASTDDTLYFGFVGYDYDTESYENEFYRWDMTNQKKAWSTSMPVEGETSFQAAAYEGTIYLSLFSVRAIDAESGQILWEFPKQKFLYRDSFAEFSPVRLHKGFLYAACGIGKLFVLDPKTGQLIASYPMNVDLMAEPEMADGVMRVIDYDESGTEKAEYYLNVDALVSGRTAYSEVDALFEIGQTHRAAGRLDSALAYLGLVLAGKNDYLEAVETNALIYADLGDLPRAVEWILKAYRLSPKNSLSELAFDLVGLRNYQKNFGILFNAEIDQNKAYLGLGTSSKQAAVFAQIKAVDLDGGETVWQYDFDIPSNFNPNFGIDNQAVYFYEPYKTNQKGDQYYRFDDVAWNTQLKAISIKDGKILWNRQFQDLWKQYDYTSELMKPGVAKNTVFAAFLRGNVYSVNKWNGNINWAINTLFEEKKSISELNEMESDEYTSGNGVFKNGKLYVCTSSGLTCYNAVNGQQIWRSGAGGHPYALRESGSELYLEGNFVDPATGKINASYENNYFDVVYADETKVARRSGFTYSFHINDDSSSETEFIVSKHNSQNAETARFSFLKNKGYYRAGRLLFLDDNELILLVGRPYDFDTGYVYSIDPSDMSLNWTLTLDIPVTHVFLNQGVYHIFLRDGTMLSFDRNRMFLNAKEGRKWWH